MLLSHNQYLDQLPRLSHLLNINGFKNLKIRDGSLTSNIYAKNYQYDFLIQYNFNYQQPTLYFKLYEIRTEDGFESSIPLKDPKPQLSSDYNFKIDLKDTEHGIWWFIHPCDTDLILQNAIGTQDTLIDWFSVYCGCFMGIKLSSAGLMTVFTQK